MNEIPTRQNESVQLDRLAASRQIYSRAKLSLGISLLLSVPIAAVLTVVARDVDWIKPYVAIWSIFLTFINFFVLERRQKENMVRAATVQEKLDCDLFRLHWRWTKPEPAPEDIVEASERFKKRNSIEPLKDWYPPIVGEVPLIVGRIICQRANCTWEKGIRNRYADALLVVFISLAVLVSFAGSAAFKTLDDFVLVILTTLVPALFLTLRLHTEHREAARSSERLAGYADGLFRDALSGKVTDTALTQRSRELQDEIFERRRTAPPVFNWAYSLLRRSNETQMNRAAAELVEQAKIVLKKDK